MGGVILHVENPTIPMPLSLAEIFLANGPF